MFASYLAKKPDSVLKQRFWALPTSKNIAYEPIWIVCA